MMVHPIEILAKAIANKQPDFGSRPPVRRRMSIMPAGAQLPLVLVNGEVTLNGEKIFIPVIRQKIETILEEKNIETQSAR